MAFGRSDSKKTSMWEQRELREAGGKRLDGVGRAVGEEFIRKVLLFSPFCMGKLRPG